MRNVKMKIVETINMLKLELVDARQDEQFGKVAELRLEIARLQAILSETY